MVTEKKTEIRANVNNISIGIILPMKNLDKELFMMNSLGQKFLYLTMDHLNANLIPSQLMLSLVLLLSMKQISIIKYGMICGILC